MSQEVGSKECYVLEEDELRGSECAVEWGALARLLTYLLGFGSPPSMEKTSYLNVIKLAR